MNNKTCQNCKWYKDIGENICNHSSVLGQTNKTVEFQRSQEGLCKPGGELWEALPFSIKRTWLWRKLKK